LPLSIGFLELKKEYKLYAEDFWYVIWACFTFAVSKVVNKDCIDSMAILYEGYYRVYMM